jgi:hypothetical protein
MSAPELQGHSSSGYISTTRQKIKTKRIGSEEVKEKKWSR